MNKLTKKFPSTLLCISGGQDSIALMYGMLYQRQTWIDRVGILHCQHGWTQEDLGMASQIAQLATSLAIPYYCMTTPRALLDEQSARLWRYESATRIANRHGYSVVVTAHTATDTLETIMANLLRGGGLSSLRSLQSSLESGCRWTGGCLGTEEWWAAGVDLVSWRSYLPLSLSRPAYTIRRVSLTGWGQQWNLPIYPDPIHQQFQGRRNRIRYELLPYLETHWNPATQLSLQKMSNLLEEDISYLELILRRIQ